MNAKQLIQDMIGLGMGVREIARSADLTPGTVSRINNGSRGKNPSYATVTKLQSAWSRAKRRQKRMISA